MAILRNYNTLSQFNSESVHPENKICFIKDNGVLYSNGVQYSPSKMDTIDNTGDSDSIVDKFNELRNNLLKSNLMTARTPHTIIYWAGNSNTINISGTSYAAQADKVNIDGIEYYQLKFDKDLDNNFNNFSSNTFTKLIFKDVDTSNVTSMNGRFYNCKSITSLDVSKFDTSNVTDMSWMFGNCSALTSLDVSRWDTSKVTSMYNMFNGCGALTSLDVSRWNTSKVTNMSFMFGNCRSLTSLDLSGWDTSNVNNMRNMFSGCGALKTIRMVGCSQTTIDKIKAQLSGNGITGCTIVTE